MNYKSRFFGSTLSTLRQALVTAFTVTILLAFPVAGNAQETSSAIRGTVTDEAGRPVAGASITLRNDAVGLTRSTTSNASGEFSLRNLPIDTNYTVSVSSEGYKSGRIDGLAVNLGQTASVAVGLITAGEIEEIIVTASAEVTTQIATGPSASFGLEALQNAPAINRNITDVLRADPRIYVDESRGDINAVQCGGKNSRFNSLTVDGVRMNDSFGLNSNGYPTERMPFSYDAINQVSIELAPFDVEYGGFSACNINAVTKSGGNEFSGSAFYDYTDNDLRADKLEGDDINTGDYDQSRYGVTFGGPIIQDKLFFFLSYEHLDGANLFDRGPLGSGAVDEVNLSQADLQRIIDISNNLYQYDPGGIPAALDHDDDKFLLKLDWNINDQQRAAFTYTYNDGENFTQSDGGLDEFELSNHLYERGAELNSYAGSLYSDWNDNFSTELRVSYLDLDNRQISVGGTDFGEIRVETPDVDVYIGGDDSRQSNKLSYDVTTIALKGKYYMDGGHNLTFGVEYESLDIFNLFVQHTETEIRFPSIDAFEAGLASAIYYNNAPSNIPNDAAADWGYEVNTVYAQDEIDVSDRLTLVAGLRYDWYTSDDKPLENTDFTAEYGFTNAQNLDGEGLLQPRFGVTFDWTDDTTVRGGVGLYSGGDPNVWLSNNFSANNVLQFGQRGRSFNYTDGSRSLFDPDIVWEACEAGVPTGPGYCIPGEMYDAVAAGTGDNFEINYLDPDFDLPSEWKLAVGVTHVFPGDYIVNADFLYTYGRDSAIIRHGDLEQVGTVTNESGTYPEYDSVREPSFVLTNSGEGNRSKNFSVSLNKAIGENFDYTIGYSWNDAEDVQPMTSSVAFSNYQNRAFFDPEEDVRSTSNYSIENRVAATANWRKTFADRIFATLSLYGSYNSGRPFSYTYNGTINPYGFTPFLDFRDNVLAASDERNGEEGSSWTKVDMRINVDFPGFMEDHQASAFLVIDNLTNLLNDDWGILDQYNFPRTVVRGTEEPRIGDASRYEISFGVQYEF